MTASKMNVNGVSVCATGQENYERFEARRGKWFYQYDYRHTDGELFSVVLPTLDGCRKRRDEWIADKVLRQSVKQEIRQNGTTVLHSTDGVSIPVIFNNLIGRNSDTAQDYRNYINGVAIPEMGFVLGDIELIADGVTVKTGKIRQSFHQQQF